MNGFWGGVVASVGVLCCVLTLAVILWPLISILFFGGGPVHAIKVAWSDWRNDRRKGNGPTS